MKASLVISASIVALSAAGCSDDAARATRPAAIEPVAAVLRLGQHQRFVEAVPGSPLQWRLLGLTGSGFISQSGNYYAPIRPPATPRVLIQATTHSATASAQVTISNAPLDTLDCGGEGQSAGAPQFGEYTYIEVLPRAVRRVAPIYPQLAREAGVDGTVQLQVLVCACGQVMKTRVTRSIPMLDAAALAAVRQWEFTPALNRGEPVAVWLALPVKFSLQ